MPFNEDSRVKIPALVHLTRLGYVFLPKTQMKHIHGDTNIFVDTNKNGISLINHTGFSDADLTSYIGEDFNSVLAYVPLYPPSKDNQEGIFDCFTQFDFPISASQASAMGKPELEGKPYKASGGVMVWNEELKREVPVGWEVSQLGDVLQTVLGGTPSTNIKEYWENGHFHWLNSGEIADFPVVNSELRITEQAIKNSATELLPKGSTLLSITRHLRPTILAIEACANQSVVGIRENGDIRCYYLYPYLQNEIPRLMTLRTGAQQPHINKEIVDSSFIALPTDGSGILKKYNEISEPFFKLIISNATQNQELTRLRDFLLPLLMNGQARISE